MPCSQVILDHRVLIIIAETNSRLAFATVMQDKSIIHHFSNFQGTKRADELIDGIEQRLVTVTSQKLRTYAVAVALVARFQEIVTIRERRDSAAADTHGRVKSVLCND
jgi:hypothetical protein